jgi:putative restriction endonuclease
MPVRLVVAVTDDDWFESLRLRPDLQEVNFWAPSSPVFRALVPGELFLFKLHSPRNFIVGGGVFAHANAMPCSLAWQAFGEANGASSLPAMRARIAKYRKIKADDKSDFVIGCRILTQPFFLPETNWIPIPEDWSRQIVTFKTYSTGDTTGLRLWDRVQEGLHPVLFPGFREPAPRFGEPTLVVPRLGQGAFRVLVTDIYDRRCAITRERTLPALEAAHIRPYAEGGEHSPSNGLLLRRDIHSLFDGGYVTVTPDFRFEVSRKIKEEYENGRHYYALHGTEIEKPKDPKHLPEKATLLWHNETLFRG